jgi:UDP-N-acetylmuramate--alanine ligase
LAQAVASLGTCEIQYVRDRSQLAKQLQTVTRRGDVVLTMGAGDITRTGPELLALLQQDGLGTPA